MTAEQSYESAFLGFALHPTGFVVRLCGWHEGQREATMLCAKSGLDVSHGICADCRENLMKTIK